MLRFKMNVLQELKQAGYSTYRVRAEKILSEGTMQRLRTGSTSISVESLGILCNILQCQPGDILEWIPEDREQAPEGIVCQAEIAKPQE